jgi:hypothetical protein
MSQTPAADDPFADETELLNYVVFDVELPATRPDQFTDDPFLYLHDPGRHGRHHHHHHHHHEHGRRPSRHHARTVSLEAPFTTHPTRNLILLLIKHTIWRIVLLLAGLLLFPLALLAVVLHFFLGLPGLWLADCCAPLAPPPPVPEVIAEDDDDDDYVVPALDPPPLPLTAWPRFRLHFFKIICLPVSILALAFASEVT